MLDEYGEPREKEGNIYWYQCEDLEYRIGFEVTNEIAVKWILATYKDMSEAKELPTRPEDCAHDYAYAVINGHGRRQFALFDYALQEETRESFAAQGWMTTKSSPFITNHEEIKISDLEYEIIFSPNPFPGDLDSGPEYQVLDTTLYVTLVQEGEYYKITRIVESVDKY